MQVLRSHVMDLEFACPAFKDFHVLLGTPLPNASGFVTGHALPSQQTSLRPTDMYIYIFRSDVRRELQAFAGDAAGSKLPDRFGPWQATGVVRPDKAPPYNLPRDEIQRAITIDGFQLWRLKPKVPMV
jgi:hypothetical protein